MKTSCWLLVTIMLVLCIPPQAMGYDINEGRHGSRTMRADHRSPSTDGSNVIWYSPSRDSSGSMPLGNGDIGLNVWVEADGDLLFYMGKTDAWSEINRLLKVGRVRVSLSPNPFAKGKFFRQTLKLGQGEIEILGGNRDQPDVLRLWVDANRPVIWVEVDAVQPVAVRVSTEIYRKEDRALEGVEVDSAYGMDGAPHPVVEHADTLVSTIPDAVAWYHRNPTSIYPETMHLQGLDKLISANSDPLINRTFGALIRGRGLVKESDDTLVSGSAGKKHIIGVHVLTEQTPTADQWVRHIEDQAKQSEFVSLSKAREQHYQWWTAFWNRSWIHVSGSREADAVTRAYTLQRFVSACGGRGAYPIKFNGSIFTVDSREPGKVFDADYRDWGGPYWFQNTRLIYWPMMACGDIDIMQPLFKMYLDILPLAKERTKLYFGHDGAFFPETLYSWGAYANSNYGWNREGKSISDVYNNYIRRYWQGGLELTAMMFDRYAYTQDRRFAEQYLLPISDAVVTFYDQHYPRQADGKLRFEPAQSLETFHKALNPLPEIAGLQWVLKGLLDLPTELTSEEQRAAWTRLLSELPPLPKKTEDGHTILLPAEDVFGGTSNAENPELYAVFPYRLFGVGKPDIDLARYTYENRKNTWNSCWSQDNIQAALLGLSAEARRMLVERSKAGHLGSRFPVFWKPDPDWVPDEDHGGVFMMALQNMLLQSDDGMIRLLPAWPKEWDVDFRLHAPQNTVVEATYRKGRLAKCVVTPASRKSDLVLMDQN